MEDFKFTATVKDVSITGLNKFLNAGAGIDVNPERPEATVKFSLDFDAREFGIRSILVIVESVTANITWECNEDELTAEEIAKLVAAGGTHYNNGKIEGEFSVNSSNEGWKINDDDLKFKEDGQLLIDEVEIDLIAKTIKVI